MHDPGGKKNRPGIPEDGVDILLLPVSQADHCPPPLQIHPTLCAPSAPSDSRLSSVSPFPSMLPAFSSGFPSITLQHHPESSSSSHHADDAAPSSSSPPRNACFTLCALPLERRASTNATAAAPSNHRSHPL